VERGLLAMLYAVPLTVAWTVAGVHIALGVGAAFAFAWGLLHRRAPLARTAADAGWCAWALALVVACAAATPETRTWMPLKKVPLILLVHVAALALAGPRRARWALRLVVSGISVTGLVAIVHFTLVPHADTERLRGTTHYMTFAGLLLLALPLAVAGTCALRGRARVAYAAAMAVLGFGLVLTFTRGAWLGAVLAFALVLLRLRPRLAALLPVAVLLMLVFMPGPYRERALSAFDPQHPTNRDRQRLWRAGLEIWRDHPWTGVGLGDLKPVYERYARGGEGRVHGHLHSNWIQILASMGSLGIVAFLSLQILLARLLWRATSAAADPELHALAVGAWAAFWGFHVMGLFEWNWGDVEIAIALYFMLGVCSGLAGAAGTPGGAALFQQPTWQRSVKEQA
jgi:O-antigen ligase